MSTDFPYLGAIFDLDGTLLDSLGVWARVDEAFFHRRGLIIPEDYQAAVSSMTFLECAEYTRRRFHLPESNQEIWAEWQASAEREYAENVSLKPGAAQYLRALKRAGIRLAVATVLPEAFYGPCLERHGLLDLFDDIETCYGSDDADKSNGRIFAVAADAMGVSAEACIGFDDVRSGVVGLKAAGMRAVCFHDDRSAHNHPEEAADQWIHSWDEAPLPEYSSARAVICTAHCEGDLRDAYAPRPGDFLLAADGGYTLLKRAGFAPDELIGDLDSLSFAEVRDIPVYRYPVEKDDTDTLLCLRRALMLGYDDILLLGGVGGRIDHTIAILQTLRWAAERHARIALSDGRIQMYVVKNGALSVPRRSGKLSVFSLSEISRSVTIRGAHYPLEDGTLTSGYPLGVSNSFVSETAEISVEDGALLVVVGARDE